ncbi:MAG: hypothetical protein HYV27_07450 [Candidatus Hydrogenedentes bacterium]|nr:hypothetical protein [Candidatus Hydrogenedentota bacterium]
MMKRIWALLALVLMGVPAWSETPVPVPLPWEEFRALYREHIERELKETLGPELITPQVHVVESAAYRIDVGETDADCSVRLSGRILGGTPTPIPLLGGVVLTAIEEVSGGALIYQQEEDRLALLPDGSAAAFIVACKFRVRTTEDDSGRVVAFATPPALQGTLTLSLPPETVLLEAPGVAGTEGGYHLVTADRLALHYRAKAHADVAPVIEVDLLTRVSVQQNRLLLETHLHPVRPVSRPVILRVPGNAALVSTALKNSQIRMLEEGRLELRPSAEDRTPFSVELSLEIAPDNATHELVLPLIEGNTGREGRFILVQPDDGQVTAAAEELVSAIPMSKLGLQFAEGLAPEPQFNRAPPGLPITLTFNRYTPLNTPAAVLEEERYTVAFEESGSALTTLTLDLPPESGPRLHVDSVPGAEVWSLTVNGAAKSVYTAEDGAWIVPLDPGKLSHVELTFLSQGEKLGLQGELQVVLPKIGFPAQRVRVALVLPSRVELRSLEGPVSADNGAGWDGISKEGGNPYFFSRSFHDGEAMTLSLWYKEPVNPAR